MKILLKKEKDFIKHNKNVESKLLNVQFRYCDKIPMYYPCIVVSFISFGANGYQINHEFVYKEDFSVDKKIKKYEKSK